MNDVAIKTALDDVRAREDLRARRAADPVEFVHRYRSNEDREIVALVAATCAFGNVKAIRLKLEDLLGRVGPSPARAGDEPKALLKRLQGFKHRLFRGEDVGRLIIGARRVQRDAGELGAAFEAELAAADREFAVQGATGKELHERQAEALKEALARFCDRIREGGGLALAGEQDPSGRRGPAHLLSNARAGSAAKRLFLFLRWMIRPADGIDFGLWRIPPNRLLVPVDVHIHKLSKNLGFTKRTDVSWRTAVEITRALARLDADDPIRYDFSLCHLGMVQRCPSRRDAARCEGCGVMPVCVHWQGRDRRAGAESASNKAQAAPRTGQKTGRALPVVRST
ncbi:hypothetical protein AKJ09_09184 [Labilithrix luteola]|uniref:TIGR02757 family protein n=1 Tax=Labilithrix luteola TaxID=1391654 RepID=A0A0K1Q9Q1_9BACT|nr:TIGR02757 family protein [Labilithrix luteola]AKV02521.1 hypothetical protein AKJ09_09184 [Labilithrix luteola]